MNFGVPKSIINRHVLGKGLLPLGPWWSNCTTTSSIIKNNRLSYEMRKMGLGDGKK